MMEAFRKFGESKVSKVLLTVLVASFAAWGVGGYLMPTMGAEAITVNGEGVSPQLVETTFKQRVDNISQLLGTRPSQEQLEQMQVPEQVVAESVARTALRQAAEKLGFVAATPQLQDEIMMVGAFKDESGKFSEARYRQILQQIGRSPIQFEKDLAQDIVVRQLAQMTKLETPAASITKLSAQAENLNLTLEVATVDASSVAATEPAEADLQKFYGENTTLYSKPESRDMVVMSIKRADIAKDIDVPEAAVKAAYEENKASYKLPESRVVRHILLDSREDAVKASERIKSLTDFETVANEVSKDPGNMGRGGTLGTITEKDVVPAFGKVAFSIAPNTLSAPVQSNFGWHIIWVDSVIAAKDVPYEEMKDAIAKDLKDSEADAAMERIVGLVDGKVAAGEGLEKIGKDVGVKALKLANVDAQDSRLDPQELQAGFGANEGDVSVPVTLQDGGIAYVQALKVYPARVLPLAEVKAQVATDWKKARVQAGLRQNAEKLLAATKDNANANLAELIAKSGVQGVRVETVRIAKLEDAPAWLQRNLMEVFPLAKGAIMPGVLPDEDSLKLVRMAERGNTAPADGEIPQLAKVYQQRMQADVEALLMGYVTQQAKVKLNQPYLKQIFGREVVWDTGTN
ncbi:MAG: hypothetical protein EON60_04335 [Alphaproteobacteria bacterium]|nr:MAG: hypothetical protein EON60_04335 [Alphaproteobacteria bacterium]